MITPMMKYSLVLYHKDYQTFLEQLQELGLVDVTLSNIEPTDEQRALITEIDKLNHGIEHLRKLQKEGVTPTIEFVNDTHAEESYTEAVHKIESLTVELSKVEKEIKELEPWGNFNISLIDDLNKAGIGIHFYSLFNKEFDTTKEQWSEQYTVEEISRDGMNTYFIVAAPLDEPLTIDAQPLKVPVSDYSHKVAEHEDIEKELKLKHEVIASCIPFIEKFEADKRELENKLHLNKVVRSGQHEAEGTLIMLEGWTTKDDQQKVDQFLETNGTFFIKDRPTPDDNTPILLKNNRFASLFELIGNFYALPKYGSTDLTPFFAPFYMIFFGFCLGDGGYGLLFLIAGIIMLLKFGDSMKQIAWLTIYCGAATVVFGCLTGAFFGIELGKFEAFASVRDKFLNSNNLFSLSIAVGFVHLLFGMGIKVMTTTKMFGLKYALSTIGWMTVIISSLAAMLLPMAGVKGFSMSSPVYMAIAGVGVFMMLFLNSPGKNPLVNLGTGLWNTYNDITGLMGDILSYIRLFALGLAGGVLALVFNDLALGLSPDIPVVKYIVMILILLVGHGINLFMSSLGSFVHPMRLTFVEFYKNAGFEASERRFTPLKKE